jgi:exopolysaccharide biosynthesis polyprenyl glycosylphosphotransferase
MKRAELFFNAVLVPLDFAALVLAGLVAYFLRVSTPVQGIRPAIFIVDLPLTYYMQLVVIVAGITIIIFALQGLYAMKARRRVVEEFTKIFSGVSMGMMGVIVWAFLSAEVFHSRFIVLAAYGLAVVLVMTARYIARKLQSTVLKRGYGVYRVLLVGNGVYGVKLQGIFESRPQLGYRIVKRLEVVRWSLLEQARRTKGIDEVILTDPTLPEDDVLTLLDFCDKYKIDYKYVPNLFETHATHMGFRELGGVPLVELLRTPLDGWGRIAKRVVDVVGASLGLLFLAPLFLVVVLLIKLDSAGLIFYHQTRMGRHKTPFEMYKFRSMYAKYCTGAAFGGQKAAEFERALREQKNERTEGPLFKMRDDPRITRMGRWLRGTRIDELPQLWNVLKGDMSLIGPRPHLPSEVDRYDKHHERLFTIKPGMSGMAQVNGSSGLSFAEEAKLDIGYIEHWSLRLDIILLLKTLRILLTDRNAV